jgi:oligopeptide transport system substrate-binding protein
MRKVKWIFFGYLAFVLLVIIGLSAAPMVVRLPEQDPQTLYLPYAADVKSFDPLEVGDLIAFQIVGNVYECLYNYEYETRPFKVFPELAAAMPQITEDGKVYTIPLRIGIRFYDPDHVLWPDGKGPEVVAEDLIYSWKRVLDYNATSPNSTYFPEVIKGLKEWREYTKNTTPEKIDWNRPVEGLTALDAHTLRITLSEPYPQLIYVLCTLCSAAVPRAAVEKYGADFRDHPVGTGSYCMKAADQLKQQRIVLNANPIYRGRPDIDGNTSVAEPDRMPYIKRVQLDFMEEDLPRWFMFRKGLFDGIGAVPKESFSKAILPSGEVTEEMRRENIRIIREPDPSTYFVAFNMADGILGKNKPLRQAMSLAFDREKFIRVYWPGQGVPATGIIPPGFDLDSQKIANPYAQYNLDAARSKLKEAEKIQGGPIPKLTLLFGGTDSTFRQMAEFYISQMKHIGLQIEADYTNWANYLDITTKQRNYQFTYSGWIADWPDEQNFFQLFWSKNIGPGGLNYYSYRNDEFDRIYEGAVRLSASPERLKLYRRMLEILNEDCAVIPVYAPIIVAPQHEWISNVRISDYPHGRRMYVRLDGRLRTKRLLRD